MSYLVIIALYVAAVASAVRAAQLFAEQYQQPWVPLVVIAAGCFVTARYVARGIS